MGDWVANQRAPLFYRLIFFVRSISPANVSRNMLTVILLPLEMPSKCVTSTKDIALTQFVLSMTSLLYKPYVNMIILRRQNLSPKSCQSYELEESLKEV